MHSLRGALQHAENRHYEESDLVYSGYKLDVLVKTVCPQFMSFRLSILETYLPDQKELRQQFANALNSREIVLANKCVTIRTDRKAVNPDGSYATSLHLVPCEFCDIDNYDRDGYSEIFTVNDYSDINILRAKILRHIVPTIISGFELLNDTQILDYVCNEFKVNVPLEASVQHQPANSLDEDTVDQKLIPDSAAVNEKTYHIPVLTEDDVNHEPAHDNFERVPPDKKSLSTCEQVPPAPRKKRKKRKPASSSLPGSCQDHYK